LIKYIFFALSKENDIYEETSSIQTVQREIDNPGTGNGLDGALAGKCPEASD
jgi:hypothetical protein